MDHVDPASEAPGDDDFGAPQEVQIDINRQINHLIRSFTDQNAQAQWKISQHAAEIDQLKIMLAEAESTKEAQQQAIQSQEEYIEELEVALNRRQPVYLDVDGRIKPAATPLDDPPGVDAILAMSAPLSGQPGLATSEQQAGSPDSTA